MQTPIVSIGCLTFNHEAYIRVALESFLAQRTTFPIEIIVHDDASTDRTAAIVDEYLVKYPNQFVWVAQNENQYSKGVRGITARFVFPRARGRYIALCEGDDYWTDPLKLQAQVDFLEAHPEFWGVFHETHQIDADGRVTRVFADTAPDVMTAEDTLAMYAPFHTSSLLFRNQLGSLPDWYYTVVSGDMALFSIIASHGPLKKLPGVMSVYRKHAHGITSLPGTNHRFNEQRIELIQHLDAFHGFQYSVKARKVIAAHQKLIAKAQPL